MLGKPCFVVVQANVPIIYRKQAILWIQLQLVGYLVQHGGGIGIKDISPQRPAHECVVHAKKDVGQWITFAQYGLIESRARVTRWQILDFCVVCCFKLGNDLFADIEAIV